MTENKENQSKNGLQFQFRKRYRKVDWKLLSCVDVDRIARDLDYHALQKNIMNVAFCDTQSQDFIEVDTDFIKLYRLGQYTIEYLLHCQEFLSHSSAVLEEKLRDAVKFRNEVKEKLETKQKELTEAKKESRKRKKMIAVYQGMMSATGANGFHKCTECDKAFVSASFLESHLERRHNIAVGNSNAALGGLSVDKLKIKCEELQAEYESQQKTCKELDTENRNAQESCERALSMRDTALAQQVEMEKKFCDWKEEEKRRHETEISDLQKMYNKQVNEALEEKRIAEMALIEAKRGIVSNLGALRDEEHEHDDLRQEQLQELEKQFDFKIAQLQQEIEKQARKLRDSEETRQRSEEDAQRRENKLHLQLEKRAEEEAKLKEILSNLEQENAKLQRLCSENAPVEAMYSPRARSLMESTKDSESNNNVDIIQEIIATQPVDVYKKVPVPKAASPEPRYVPFEDKPYITCQYNHTPETLASARQRTEDELALKLQEITGHKVLKKLSNEDYTLHQSSLRKERSQNEKQLDNRRERLKEELNEIARAPHPALPAHAALPPKSPSVRKAVIPSNSSKRHKTTPPVSSRSEELSPRELSPRELSPRELSPREMSQRELSPLENSDSFVSSTPVHADIKARNKDSVSLQKQNISIPEEFGSKAEKRGSIKKPVKISDVYDSDELSESEDEEPAKEQPSWQESESEDVVSELELPGEDTHTVEDYYKAAEYNVFDEEESQSYGEDYRGVEEEEVIHTAVKMRPKKTKGAEEEESIFSFDGWSKMKARNSMSVADAQENIPLGHVERMRHEVAKQHSARRKHLSVGVSMLPHNDVPEETQLSQRHSAPIKGSSKQLEEDDFTISSISDFDLSPVGMSVEVKKRDNVSDDEF